MNRHCRIAVGLAAALLLTQSAPASEKDKAAIDCEKQMAELGRVSPRPRRRVFGNRAEPEALREESGAESREAAASINRGFRESGALPKLYSSEYTLLLNLVHDAAPELLSLDPKLLRQLIETKAYRKLRRAAHSDRKRRLLEKMEARSAPPLKSAQSRVQRLNTLVDRKQSPPPKFYAEQEFDRLLGTGATELLQLHQQARARLKKELVYAEALAQTRQDLRIFLGQGRRGLIGRPRSNSTLHARMLIFEAFGEKF